MSVFVVIERGVDALVLLIDCAHQRRCWGQHLVYEDEDCLLWCQLDALSDNVHKLPDSEILAEVSSVRHLEAVANAQQSTHCAGFNTYRWHQVLLLVYCRDICLICLLADDLDADSESNELYLMQ
jgi:hypothetical protein